MGSVASNFMHCLCAPQPHSKNSLAVSTEKSHMSKEQLLIEPDYSIYTLLQLFKARYWIETRGKSLEDEIQKRCRQIRERTNGRPFAADGSRSRFRPYGLIFGVVALLCSLGPFIAVSFLDAINAISDVSGDNAMLTGVWALITLPLLVVVAMIGGRMDAERVIKWFDLDGRKSF
jgi:cytochrome c biogenesis protein CcdA